MKTLKLFVQSCYAGFMVGIGGIVYLSVENKILGSLLFCFGLLTIVTQGFALYTGRIGFVKTCSELLEMPIVIIGNYCGAFLAAYMAKAADLNIDSMPLSEKKLANGMISIFLLSVFCGVLMCLAIDNYRKSKNYLFVIAPVVIFILSGFEHSVANMFYFNLAGLYTKEAFAALLVMAAGNGIGAKIFCLGLKAE